nr:hypothetical protein [uncultured Stomatobaculum sp.]
MKKELLSIPYDEMTALFYNWSKEENMKKTSRSIAIAFMLSVIASSLVACSPAKGKAGSSSQGTTATQVKVAENFAKSAQSTDSTTLATNELKENGHCVYRNENGNITEGTRVNGEWEGQFKKSFPDGSYFEGTYINGEVDGQVRYVDTDGTITTGYWKDENWNGRCKEEGTRKDKEKYVKLGRKVDGKWEGICTTVYEKGGYFQRVYKDGVENGEATFVDDDGTIYTGTWENGAWNGAFREEGVDDNNNHYVVEGGTMVNGKWEGLVRFTFDDGEYWEKNYKDDKVVGEVTHRYRNGTITVGTWENGAWNGAFTTTFPDGSHYTGVYKDGEIIGNVIYTDEAGNTATCDPNSIKK